MENLFEGLPDELLLQVFEDSGLETLRSLSRTDRRFRDVASEAYERQQKKYRELNRAESGNGVEFDRYVAGRKRDFKKDYERHLYRNAFTPEYFRLKGEIVEISSEGRSERMLIVRKVSLVPPEIQDAPSAFVQFIGHVRELPLMSRMPNLKYLDLQGTGVEKLPGDLFQSRSLRRLVVHDQELNVSFPDDAGGSAIETLSLRIWNQRIPKQVFEMTSLKELGLSHCRIREIPNDIERLVNLEVLSLENVWSLTKISPRIGRLGKLKILNMKGTREQLPIEIAYLPSLEVLHADRNYAYKVLRELYHTRGGRITADGWTFSEL